MNKGGRGSLQCVDTADVSDRKETTSNTDLFYFLNDLKISLFIFWRINFVSLSLEIIHTNLGVY